MLREELKNIIAFSQYARTGARKGAHGAATAATSAGKTILVVDDDEMIRDLVAAILDSRGYAVQTAANGLEALSVLQRRPVDLLVTDLEMPLLAGPELAGRVWETQPHLPIVFMSGSYLGADLDEAAPGGLRAFLSKPFSFAVLVEVVDDLIARSHAGAGPAAATA